MEKVSNEVKLEQVSYHIAVSEAEKKALLNSSKNTAVCSDGYVPVLAAGHLQALWADERQCL